MLTSLFHTLITRFLPPRLTVLIKDRRLHLLTGGFILLLWTIVILPAAFVNALFTLDVGAVFDFVARFPPISDPILSPYSGTPNGRYLPLYWLYHAFVFFCFGYVVQGHYVVLAIIFLLGALITGIIFASIVRNASFTLLFCLSLFISSPNVESLYALGKPEPFVYTFVVLILLIFFYDNEHRKSLSIVKGVSIAAAFAGSLWFKETSIALFAFPVAGMAASFLLRRTAWAGRGALYALRRRYASLLVCLVCGFGISKLPFVIFEKVAGNVGNAGVSYTTFTFTWEMVTDNIFFYVTQQPDVTIIGIISSIFMFIAFKHAKSFSSDLTDKAMADLIFTISLLVTAWAYLSIFLWWRMSMAYYLYLPSFFFRFVAAYGLYVFIRYELCGRVVRVGSFVTLSLLLIHASIYFWYAGSGQVTYARVYTEALREYVRHSHSGDSLFVESYPFYAEQVSNTSRLLQNVFHGERRVYGIADLVDPGVVTPEMRQLLSVSDLKLANNEKNFPKKDDYVLAITGNALATWQVRGVAPHYSDGSFLQKDASYEMRLLAETMSYFPSIFVNVWTYNLNVRPTYFGYKLYRVIEGPRFTWLGRYPDGWIGRRGRLTLYPRYVGTALVHVSTSKYNPKNSVSVFQNDILIDRVSLYEGNEHTFKLTPIDNETPTEFRFEIEQTFVPQNLRLNKDKRELGAFVRLESFTPNNN